MQNRSEVRQPLSREPESAGLPLSVGPASIPVRLSIAAVLLLVAALVGAASLHIFACGPGAARAMSVVALTPFSLAGLLAAAFVCAPYSRYGTWVDTFIARFNGRRVAMLAFVVWLGAAAINVASSFFIGCP